MARQSIIEKFPGVSTLVLLEVLLLLVVSYQIQVDARMSLLEKTALTLFAPLQEASNNVFGTISGRFADQASRRELEAENQRLARALQGHRQVLTLLTETELENERLRDLLQMPAEQSWGYVFADVIGANHRRQDYMVTINKGSGDGVARDQGVIGPNGVIGIVWEVSFGHAKVMTANNPSAVIAAMLQDGRDSESFAVGRGGPFGSLENFPNFRTIQTGDLIITSGQDGLFPKGLHIGRAVSGNTSSYMFQDVEIRYTTEFSKLEEVVVLVPRCREDLDVLE